jgi:hypothetical protein
VGGTTYAATIPGPGVQVVVLERATGGFVSSTSYPATGLARPAGIPTVTIDTAAKTFTFSVAPGTGQRIEIFYQFRP